ncbi:MAG TPA: DUF3048 domain-containing protein [Actinomycetota bacterium]|nr:DUF3048 domain-containing protein [Actinomycetota bacterium]
MALTRRAKVSIAVVTIFVVVGVVAYTALFPDKVPAIVRTGLSQVGLVDEAPPPPPACPLTGEPAAGGVVPDRPALAIKVENYPDARPQAGLQAADVVFEEPVEGGITRFIVVYHCDDASRVGPVRSARTADPDVLAQLGVPILAYSGGAPNVVRAVEEANLLDLDETSGGAAFTRDPSRPSPHNLYVGTKALYRVASSTEPAPEPLFAYDEELTGKSRKVSSVHLPFSSTYADVWWTWDRRSETWMRSHGDESHMAEEGEQISADNLVVQVVDVDFGTRGGITPRPDLVGSGKAYVFRDGRMIPGRWERDGMRDVTRFVARDGTDIGLAPGRTWVELLPSSVDMGTER